MTHRVTTQAFLSLAAIALCAGACGGGTEPIVDPPLTSADTVMRPLTDMSPTQTYLGFRGGLYPGGRDMPAAHLAAGIASAKAIQPLDQSGNPGTGGRYVLLSIGMSNTTQEFCSQSSTAPCSSWSFMGLASADAAVNHSTLAPVNGARGGQAAPSWLQSSSAEYDRIRDAWLTPNGLTEKQVQVAWVKLANAQPAASLPAATADAYTLVSQLGTIVRTLRVRYPNLRQVYLSNRIYAGYATSSLNPEPYAYQTGFAVKWLIEAQINQAASGQVADTRAGDLDYRTVAPWLAWGPDLWARGTEPRSDGLTWVRADVESDGTHPSQSGEEKVARLLLGFFKSAPTARCWFVAGERC